MGLLDGKVVLVCGVGPGLGRQVSHLAASLGASVMMGARSADYLDKLTAELTQDGARVSFRRADVTSDDDCRALVNAAVTEFGGLDCLVSNAATSDPFNVPLEDVNLEEWKAAFDVNFFGPMRLVKASTPAFKERGGGSIVFVGSQIIRRVRAGRGAYAASKAALLTASHVLARELGPYNIRVNNVVPGRMWGPRLKSYIQQLADEQGVSFAEQRQRFVLDMSLPRMTTDEECARVIVFLASELSSGMTGQALDVNAGETFS
jgi:NAD(P)-dependent dehydrogenase (short-subunit alcohol dehydrogenase family)